MIRRHVEISGRVQGVYLRDTVRRKAVAAGVAGWVRNTRRGTVEAVFEGEDEAVDRLVEFCRVGPPAAHVERVEVSEESPEGLRDFRIAG